MAAEDHMLAMIRISIVVEEGDASISNGASYHEIV
jgi:hypothetical protein